MYIWEELKYKYTYSVVWVPVTLYLELFKGLVEFSFILRKLFISPIHHFPFLHQLNYLPIRFILEYSSSLKPSIKKDLFENKRILLKNYQNFTKMLDKNNFSYLWKILAMTCPVCDIIDVSYQWNVLLMRYPIVPSIKRPVFQSMKL